MERDALITAVVVGDEARRLLENEVLAGLYADCLAEWAEAILLLAPERQMETSLAKARREGLMEFQARLRGLCEAGREAREQLDNLDTGQAAESTARLV
jgi:hypothetical protein